MAEEEIKSDVEESKDESKLNEEENESDPDESKENISENIKENGDSKQENKEESKKNISDSESTPKKSVPLYDQPLEQSGKRVRAQAEIFKTEIKEKKEFQLECNGSGIALSEVPYIEHMINREMAMDLKKLYHLCFGVVGQKTTVKKHIRQFNGYSFDKSDKKYATKQAQLEKTQNIELKHHCEILGLEKSGTKAEIMERILDFLMKPYNHERKVQPKKRKSMSKKKSGSKKKKSDAGKKRPRKSEGGDTENDSANDSTANETANSSNSGSEGSDGESEKPKKTPAKKPKKTPAKKTASKTPAKKTPAKKTPAKKSKESVAADSDSSSDDEPLIKKTKTAPSNDELKKKVKKILDGADLEEVTMKTVCKQIYDMYPDFDLTDRKGFIKETVKEALG